MFKKNVQRHIYGILLTAALLLSSCSVSVQGGSTENIINAGGYDGVTLSSATAQTLSPASADTASAGTASADVTAAGTASAGTAAADVTAADTATSSARQYKPLNYKTVRGVWISCIELSEIFRKIPDLTSGSSAGQFRAAYRNMLTKSRNIGINTVFVQIRPFGDALYYSSVYPFSKRTAAVNMTGFDPLLIMIEETHKLNMSFQGWVNPLRLNTTEYMNDIPDDFATGGWYAENRGTYVKEVGNMWYLDPSYDETRTLVNSGVTEIVKNYDVDGIHIDDYFYPTTDPAFDTAEFAASGLSDIAAFRRMNCDKLVQGMYRAVHAANPAAVFGIAPQGHIENNDGLYADVKTWATKAGYCDYIAPQIYFGFKNSRAPFEVCVNEWEDLKPTVRIIFGLAAYKVGSPDENAGSGSDEWQTDTEILRRQIDYASQSPVCGGYILYSWDYLFSNKANPAIEAEIDAIAAANTSNTVTR